MESKQHKELKEKAIQYLYNKSHWVTRMEVNCGFYGIYDTWGIKSDLITTGIEVKVSRADFRNNKWKEHRLEIDVIGIEVIPANFNYILCPKGLLQPEEIHPKYGLLWFNGERIINKKKAEFIPMTSKRKLRIIMSFLSSKHNKN